MRLAGCQRVGHPGGPIRVSVTGLEFKVSRPARAPGICETGPAGIGKTHGQLMMLHNVRVRNENGRIAGSKSYCVGR